MKGDGLIDLHRLRGLADAAGYSGPIEVEVVNDELRQRSGREVLALVVERVLSTLC
jgi:sugar phosphate isomerase/epimerase